LRRLIVILALAAVVVMVAAVPAMAQDDKAARKAARQAQKAQKAPGNEAPKKATPETGGANVALLSAGALLVAGGIVAVRRIRR
jgi:LPXTG-motif cell wall-anchored protein